MAIRKGTTLRFVQRYSAVGIPSIAPSMVRSNRIAPITFSPLKAGDLMIRARMSWIRPYISSSVDHAPSSMPYWRSALGVEPPDWSSAAMKPAFCDICRAMSALPSVIVISMFAIVPTLYSSASAAPVTRLPAAVTL